MPLGLIASLAANATQVAYARSTAKREITFAGTPVDKSEFDKLTARVDGLIFLELKGLSNKVATIEATLTATSVQVYQVDSKMDRLIERFLPTAK